MARSPITLVTKKVALHVIGEMATGNDGAAGQGANPFLDKTSDGLILGIATGDVCDATVLAPTGVFEWILDECPEIGAAQ